MPAEQRPRRPQDAPAPLVLTPRDQEDLRHAQLELLAEFDRVCRGHDLPYFALYGTLLGAARHGGFIPWDDDLDLGMLRADYERLAQVAPEALGDRFFFQTVDSDPHYGCMFGKLRLRETRCVDRVSYGSPQHGGVFIDVFPLDAKAVRPWARRAQWAWRYIGFRLMYLKAGYLFMMGTSVPSRLAQTAARTVTALLPRRLIVAVTTWHTRLGASDAPDRFVSLFGGYVYDRDTIEAEWIHPLTQLPFEGGTIPALADTDAYLTRIYRDWRQPPPPEQRIGHHGIVELDLGPRAG